MLGCLLGRGEVADVSVLTRDVCLWYTRATRPFPRKRKDTLVVRAVLLVADSTFGRAETKAYKVFLKIRNMFVEHKK